MYDRLVSSPGNNISLGSPEGGVLILAPPSLAPGAMNVTMMQSKVLFLLREDGPDTGYTMPQVGDFNAPTILRDLNIAFAEFLSQTGLSPGLVERQVILPVFPVQDHPVPPDMQSLTNLEYTIAGQQTYTMLGLSFSEWTSQFGLIQTNLPSGPPTYYRTPFAGYIRLMPAPSIGNAVGPGIGVISVNGSPSVGQKISATLINPGATPVVTGQYAVVSTDTLQSIAVQLSNLINASNAVIGPLPFLAPTSVTNNQVNLSALIAPGTSITYQATITGTGATVTPTSASPLSPNGDTMTWYYTAAGNTLINPGDSPHMPSQFHMAPVYRVLADYWMVKQDFNQANAYMKRFDIMVRRGMTFTFDTDRSTQPTIAGINDQDFEDGLPW